MKHDLKGNSLEQESTSSCCDASFIQDTDVCRKCKEHASVREEEE